MHPFLLYLRNAILGALLGFVAGFLGGMAFSVIELGDVVLPGDNFAVLDDMTNGAVIGAFTGIVLGLFLMRRALVRKAQVPALPLPDDPQAWPPPPAISSGQTKKLEL